jgi:uncharacterized protein
LGDFKRRKRGGSRQRLEIGCVLYYHQSMDRNRIIETLLENRAALESKGVKHAALFGSRARGDATEKSDIDIMIDLDPDAHYSVYDYVGLKEYIGSLFPITVDVVDREGLKPYVKPRILADAIDVF